MTCLILLLLTFFCVYFGSIRHIVNVLHDAIPLWEREKKESKIKK